jgi:UDP-glucose 4-epimerase
MKILITGGAGFVGSHLADKLLGEGHEITVIDDLSTGRYSNVAHLEGQDNFRLIIDTVLDAHLMERLVGETDRVYHMASAVGVRLIMEQPVKTIETIFTAPMSCLAVVRNTANASSFPRRARFTARASRSRSGKKTIC